MEGILGQIGLVLLVCVGLGATAIVLRLPLLVGLLIAGVLVGPEGLGLVASAAEIEVLGEIGISLLLFVVGLKLDPRLVRQLGPVVFMAGMTQVVLTAVIAYALALGAGLAVVPSLYLAAGMSFSSTVVVVKLLADRGNIEELHGRIALGILIVQDLVVVAVMVLLASFDAAGDASLFQRFTVIGLRGAALFLGVGLLARFALPRATHLLARRGELLVLAGVAWAVAIAALSHLLGFSVEVGAFIAGVALASSDYRDAISGRLATLRDFLLVFFFIDLGTQLRFEGADDLGLIVTLSVFVLVGKPLLIAIITTVLGFQSRVAVRAGLTLAQISEFSLILATVGVTLGHIEGRTAGIMAAVALATITASTFINAREGSLTEILADPLTRLQRARLHREHEQRVLYHPQVIVLGVGRLGRTVLEELAAHGDPVLGVDFDPRIVRSGTERIPIMFGDLEDPELPGQIPLDGVEWIVATPRDPELHRTLLHGLRRHGFRGRVAVTLDDAHDEMVLRRAGVDLVLHPLKLAARPLIATIHAYDRDRADELGTIE